MLTPDDVEAFFAAVLDRDAKALARIADAPGDARFEGGRFVFSIAGLWSILDRDGEFTLAGFRKLLYSSDLNRRLGARGAAISVYQSRGKVPSSLYALGPLDPVDRV